jgi:hypothetical protein
MDYKHTKCCVESKPNPGYVKEHFFLLRRRHGTAPLHSIRQVKPRIWCGRLVPASNMKKDIALLEKVQHRATRLSKNLCKLDYETRLKKLKLQNLERRRERGDLIQAFKIGNTHGKQTRKALLEHAVTKNASIGNPSRIALKWTASLATALCHSGIRCHKI